MKYLKKLFSRTSFMIIMIILEILLIASVFKWFGDQAAWIEIVLRILSVFIVLGIINNSKHLSADMLYILAIMISPVFGTAVYLLIRANLLTSSSLRSFVDSNFSSFKDFSSDHSTFWTCIADQIKTGSGKCKCCISNVIAISGFCIH